MGASPSVAAGSDTDKPAKQVAFESDKAQFTEVIVEDFDDAELDEPPDPPHKQPAADAKTSPQRGHAAAASSRHPGRQRRGSHSTSAPQRGRHAAPVQADPEPAKSWWTRRKELKEAKKKSGFALLVSSFQNNDNGPPKPKVTKLPKYVKPGIASEIAGRPISTRSLALEIQARCKRTMMINFHDPTRTVLTKRGRFPYNPPLWALCFDFVAFLLGYLPIGQLSKAAQVSNMFAKALRMRRHFSVGETFAEHHIERFRTFFERPESVEFQSLRLVVGAHVGKMLQSFTGLLSLSLNDTDVGDASLGSVVRECYCLTSLTLLKCTHLDSPVFASTTLRSLTIRDCDMLQKVVTTTSELRTLTVERLGELTDSGLADIVSSSPALETVYIRECDWLESLSLVGNFSTLTVRHCFSLWSLHIESHSLRLIDIYHHDNLNKLSLVSNSLAQCGLRNCARLQTLATDLPALQQIAVDDCPMMTDTMTQSFLDGIKGAVDVTLASFLAVRYIAFSHFENLTILNLFRCVNLTDNGAQMALHELRQLEALSLEQCHEITSPNLVGLENLDILSYSGCANLMEFTLISSSVLVIELVNNPNLRRIHLRCEAATHIDLADCPLLDKFRWHPGCQQRVLFVSVGMCRSLKEEDVEEMLRLFAHVKHFVGPKGQLSVATGGIVAPENKRLKLAELDEDVKKHVLEYGFAGRLKKKRSKSLIKEMIKQVEANRIRHEAVDSVMAPVMSQAEVANVGEQMREFNLARQEERRVLAEARVKKYDDNKASRVAKREWVEHWRGAVDGTFRGKGRKAGKKSWFF